MAKEKVLNYEGLELYHGKSVALMDEKDAAVLLQAKEYAEGLGENYDAAGTAQTKVDALANGAVKDNTDAIATLNGDAKTEGSVAKAVADAKAELEQKITDSEYDDTELSSRVDNLETNKADKTQVATDIEEAVKAETDARVEAVKAIQDEVDALEQTVEDNKTAVESRVKAIEDDYLVEADKTELQGNIDTLAGEVTKNAQAIATLNGEGEGSVKKTVDDAINKFATDVTDDAVVNSYKELIDWVAEHGSEAAEMAEAIQTNKTNIAELEALVGTLPEGTTAKTVVELIQSLVNAEKTRAEGVEGGLDERLTEVEGKVGEAVDTQITNAIADLDADVTSATVDEGKGIQVQVVEVDGKVTSVAVTGNYDNSYDAKGAASTAETNAKTYADGLNTAMDTRVATTETDIANLKTTLGEGVEPITEDEINALFVTSAE